MEGLLPSNLMMPVGMFEGKGRLVACSFKQKLDFSCVRGAYPKDDMIFVKKEPNYKEGGMLFEFIKDNFKFVGWIRSRKVGDVWSLGR